MIFFLFFQKGLASNAQTNPDIENHQLPGNGAKNLLGKNQALTFIKTQAQGSSLSTWGVVRKELRFKYRDSLQAAQSRPSEAKGKK